MTDEHKTTAFELYQRLSETAAVLRKHQLMSDSQIATGFMGVGLALAKETVGPVCAAEWLRDIADYTEAADGGLQ